MKCIPLYRFRSVLWMSGRSDLFSGAFRQRATIGSTGADGRVVMTQGAIQWDTNMRRRRHGAGIFVCTLPRKEYA